MSEYTAAGIVDKLPEFFQPEKAGSTTALIAFDLSGEDPGQHWVKVENGTCTAGHGPAENPNLTLLADSSDFVKIMTGQLDGTSAFMQGKLKIKGDMGLALKFQGFFRRPG